METVSHHAGALAGLLAQMLLFFGISGLIIPLLQRWKMTPVLGYLLCGVVVGPYGLGLWADEMSWLQAITITNRDTVELLGELGVIAMLFMIGLELSFQRLRELKHYVLGLGSLQIIVSSVAIFGVAYYFGNSLAASLLLGASLALSSTAIVMQLLHENHLGNRKIGVLSFSILLMQDLAVVPIVVLASAFTGDMSQGVLNILLESVLIAVGAVVSIYLIGRLALRPLMRVLSVTRNSEWLTAFVLFIVVASATVTQSAGLSAALGAFLAGLLIAETECLHSVEIIINPLKGLLLGIFFLSIGMMIDLREVWYAPFWMLFSVGGIFILKAAILYPLCRCFRVPVRRSAEASIMLAQPGEFAFLILSVALASGLMPHEDGQFFLLVTAMSMLLAPIMFKLAPVIGGIVDKGTIIPEDVQIDIAEKKGQVLIAGFGRIGLQLAKILERQGIPYQAIDHNMERVRELTCEGYKVLYGDAKYGALWNRIGADYARAVIITVDDHEAAERILTIMQSNWPLLPVIMRAQDTADTQRLYAKGARHVIPEVEETSRQLARLLLEELKLEKIDIYDILQRERQEEILPVAEEGSKP